MSEAKHPKLIVLDLDNSLLDWFLAFSWATKKSIETAAQIINVPYSQLCEEFKQILDKEDSIEHPFVIQQLPSVLNHYNYDFDRILTECSEPARAQFKVIAYPYLKPYPNVLKTLQKLKTDYPNTKLVILTDAPHQIALHRLNKLGILNYFDGVYGVENPKLPIIKSSVAVTKEILFKHLDAWKYGFIGRLRVLPIDYRKPSVKGLKTILLEFNIEQFSKEDIIFAGDNVFKDIAAGLELGVTSVWLRYGIKVDQTSIDALKDFVPERFIHKGINLKDEDNYPKADYTIDDFSELLNVINQSASSQSLPDSIPSKSD